MNLRVHDRDYPLRSTIAGVEERLTWRFLRVHRSYIVNLDRIASIEPLDTGDARCTCATAPAVLQPPLSRPVARARGRGRVIDGSRRA